MNTDIETFFLEGCGRCKLGGTPDCKVHRWQHELEVLRRILLDCGLTETVKWGFPCYMCQQKNILLLSVFKEYAALLFFKGALLQDEDQLLTLAGENSQAGRQFRFTSVEEIIRHEAKIKAYVFEAVELEKAGVKVPLKTIAEHPIPEEFQLKLQEFPALKMAFERLTPGRQRAYLLHFGAPKQSQTRINRIEKCIPTILQGKGMHD